MAVISDYLAYAREIVEESGRIARQEFGHSQIVREKQFHDIVTQADLRVQEYVRGRIKALYPDHGFDSEEDEVPSRDTDLVWVLDPIDGTKYFSRGIPIYSISLALERRRSLVVGVVYSPETNQMFWGAIGEGASLNGSPIQCTSAPRLRDATICVEIPSRDSPAMVRGWGIGKLGVLVDNARRVRILGVTALDLCYCASGGFDAYVNLGSAMKYCDFAAGQVIVEAAGGKFMRMARGIVAGSSTLCDELIELIGFKDD